MHRFEIFLISYFHYSKTRAKPLIQGLASKQRHTQQYFITNMYKAFDPNIQNLFQLRLSCTQTGYVNNNNNNNNNYVLAPAATKNTMNQ